MLGGYIKLVREYWSLISFGLLAVFVGNFGQSFFISWYGVEIQKSLSLSASLYGSAYSAATLISGLCIMFIGGVIDRVSLDKFVIATACGLFVAALVMWQANSLFTLVLGLFLLRFCGQGLMPHTAMTAIARYFTSNRGKAISFASNGVPLGEILLPAFAVVTIVFFGWRNSWLIVALAIPIVFLPALLFLLHKTANTEHREKMVANGGSLAPDVTVAPGGSRRTLLRDVRFWRALPLILAPPFIVTGIFIHQSFILQEKGWSSALFATAFIVYGLTHWLGSMLTGSLVDRFSAAIMLPFLGGPFILGLSLGALIQAAWVSYLMMGLLGIGIGMATTIFNAVWVEAYGTTHLGSIRALTSSMIILSTSISPILLGFLIDADVSAQSILLLMAGYAFCASILAGFSFKASKYR